MTLEAPRIQEQVLPCGNAVLGMSHHGQIGPTMDLQGESERLAENPGAPDPSY